MQAVILAGGYGSRLGPMTHSVPKPMIQVLGKPFLEYQLAFAKLQGVTDVVLCLGYLHEKIEDYFGDGNTFGLRIKYTIEEKPMGTALAIKLASSLLESSFLLLNGDSYLPVEYSELFARLKQANAYGVITVYPNLKEVFKNNVRQENDLVIAYSRQSMPGLNCLMSGASVFGKKLIDLIKDTDTNLETDVFPRLIALRKLQTYTCEKWFYDIGTPASLEIFRHYAQNLNMPKS